MDLGTYLKWNFIIGGSLALLILVGVFVFSNPSLALLLVLLIAIFAYRYYRKEVYFEGYDE